MAKKLYRYRFTVTASVYADSAVEARAQVTSAKVDLPRVEVGAAPFYSDVRFRYGRVEAAKPREKGEA